MSAPYTTGQACNSTVVTANNAGAQICLTATNQPAAPVVPTGSGFGLHTVTVGADTTANTLTVFDGTSTSGTVIFKMITPTATVPQTFTVDVSYKVGLFFSLAGGTTPTWNISWT
jgi:hypothetical protein